MSKRFDVVAVNLKTLGERVLTSDKSEEDAEAFIKIAIARRGVEEEFYKLVPVAAAYSCPS